MAKEREADFRGLPAVDALLKSDDVKPLVEKAGRELVTFAVRESIERARQSVKQSAACPPTGELVESVKDIVALTAEPSLKPVINATGVILHTNLGRVPLGDKVLRDIGPIVCGYSNLEFDLEKAERGHRNVHISRLLAFITGAERALVVNNNAAALVLALSTLAAGKEVIISRGELIEIGGSFRIPEILATSGALMVEVGTTNKTRIADYEKAITSNTAILLKAHKSNYTISGFTEEASVSELASLAKKSNLVMLYDIGSGLLRKPARLPLETEPDVRSSLREGADLVAFSGDKLLGGPQSGIIVGKKDLVSRLEQAPLMRALRVGKLTISALSSVARSYLTDESLRADLPLFRMLGSSQETLKKRAERLVSMLRQSGIAAKVVESKGQCGGGTLPDVEIESYAVAMVASDQSQQARSDYAKRVYQSLLTARRPVVGVLRQGELVFDMLTLDDSELEEVNASLRAIISGAMRS
jgi:L-seryl-tRNA(Ser) seleniumtransferase